MVGMDTGISPTWKSTEFLMGVLVVVCSTVLLALDKVDQDTWKWAATTVGGAYIIGRSAVKTVGSTATAKLADFKADLSTLAAADTEESAAQVTNVVNQHSTDLDRLHGVIETQVIPMLTRIQQESADAAPSKATRARTPVRSNPRS